MKTNLFIIKIWAISGTLFITSCSRSEKIKVVEGVQYAQDKVTFVAKNTQEGLNQTATDIQREKEKMANRLDEKQMDLEDEIDQLDEKIKYASAEEKIRWESRKQKLQQNIDELDLSIRELKSESKKEWSAFKVDLNKKIDDIQRNIQ